MIVPISKSPSISVGIGSCFIPNGSPEVHGVSWIVIPPFPPSSFSFPSHTRFHSIDFIHCLNPTLDYSLLSCLLSILNHFSVSLSSLSFSPILLNLLISYHHFFNSLNIRSLSYHISSVSPHSHLLRFYQTSLCILPAVIFFRYLLFLYLRVARGIQWVQSKINRFVHFNIYRSRWRVYGSH